MKIFAIACLCFLALGYQASAQKIVVDSSFANAYKKQPLPVQKAQETAREDSESMGRLIGKIGEGIWQRLKYRLNLEEVQEGLEAKKQKYSGKTGEEDQSPRKGG